MKSRFRQLLEPADHQRSLFSLQKNLLQVWENLNVDQYYQNLILAHLDSLPGQQAQNVIAKQIKATHEGSSQYFKLAQRLRIRKKELAALSSLVESEASGQELAEISQLLGELRDHNLAVAEMLIGLHKQYSAGGSQVSDKCMQMLQSLDSDNNFLKESFLSQFILFQKGYDPFFLNHYDKRGKKSTPQTHPLIDQLFNLNLSYACRLFKAKTKALQMLSEGKFNETKTVKRRSKSYGRRRETKEHQPEAKAGTSSNLNVRKVVSLEKAKERQRMQTIDVDIRDSPTRQPIINKQKMYSLMQDQPSEQSEQQQEAYKLVPVRYRVKKSMPRSQFLQELRKKSLPVDQDEEPQMKYLLNFKQKLEPLKKKSQTQDESSNRNSVFRRLTVKEPFLPPFPTSSAQGSLQSRRTKDLAEEAFKSTNSSQGKDIKMRPGKLSIGQLKKYLKSLDISQQLKNQTILNPRFEETLAKCQAYLSDLLINGQIKAVGMSFALPDGDYLVKLWAPLRSCDEENSKLLLRKYLEYLEKKTGCGSIYYGGNSRSLFLSLDFQQKNDKLLFRNRTNPLPTRKLEFLQFLSFKCSSILFPQENKSVNMLYSDEIECFSSANHYLMPAFVNASRQGLPGAVQMTAKVSQDIADMKALNSLLEDEQLDTYQVASSMKIAQISAIRLSAIINLRSSFLAAQGNFRLAGEQLLRRGETQLVRIQGVQLGAFILLGKGFPSIVAFAEAIRQAQGLQRRRPCQFAVRMFSKQLYGRISNEGSQLCCYGNWEFSLSWKDELQGRVRHNFSNLESFGPEPFYFGVQLQRELFFCFQVTNEDFLY